MGWHDLVAIGWLPEASSARGGARGARGARGGDHAAAALRCTLLCEEERYQQAVFCSTYRAAVVMYCGASSPPSFKTLAAECTPKEHDVFCPK